MAINLVEICEEKVQKQFDEIIKETVRTMKALAPEPTGRKKGKGSMATLATRNSIAVLEKSETRALIGPQTPYAKYAEDGRGAISKPYHMRFIGSDGQVHYAKEVAGMEGWKFAELTAKIIRAKYGR